MGVEEVEKIVVVYQRQCKKPLGEMIRGRCLGGRRGGGIRSRRLFADG
jgi:hypothetical protein